MDKIIEQRSAKGSSIGFGAEVKAKEGSRSLTESFRDVEPEDLVKFGLIPEFIGRLPVLATLTELDLAALMQILSQPKNALVKQFAALFQMENVELEFREDALKAIAQKAMERKNRCPWFTFYCGRCVARYYVRSAIDAGCQQSGD